MFKKNSKGTIETSNAFLQESLSSEKLSHSVPLPFQGLESFRQKFSHSENLSQPEIYIGESVKVEGILAFESFAKIDGVFSGELHSKGKVHIGPQAVVKADLFLEEVYSEGIILGNITVSRKLTLVGAARVEGNIIAPSLSIEDGVSIKGQMHVTRTSSPEEREEESPFIEEPII